MLYFPQSLVGSISPCAPRKQAKEAPAGPAPTIKRSVLIISSSAILQFGDTYSTVRVERDFDYVAKPRDVV